MALALALALGGCEQSSKPEAIDLSVYDHLYENPFPALDQEWEDYGNGDPYVMRYDGRYYLYVSTKDHRVGIKAWVSDNLVDWTYAGLVTEDPISTGAYAPEVVYWNGYFYLYTSPAGRGHYVFRSESPTGPFERITDNVGMSIDGSVFIDDDGSWTFTHAGTGGIVGVPMDGPASFDPGRTIEGAYLGHWTEGSMIIKRGGVYYMTLTGNHVFSKGYRVHYAISKDSPLGPYTMPTNNPIAISTDPEFFGLGHSSTVMGPDLDSYYLVYHNLIGRSAEGPPVRKMNIDRLVFNGDRMDLLGPTHYAQPVPRQPDFSDRLDEAIDSGRWEKAADGGRTVSSVSTGGVYTAEYNFRLRQEAGVDTRLDILFAYKDDADYGGVEFDFAGGRMTLFAQANGERKTLAEAALSEETDWTKLHAVRIERDEERVRVYVDGGLKLESGGAETAKLREGRIGYAAREAGEPLLSYVAFANAADGSSDYETAKPLPGTIEAVHYLSGEGRGFQVGKRAEAPAWRKADGTDVRQADDGSYSVVLGEKGDWLRYAVHVSESGTYSLDFTAGPGGDSASLELLVDGKSAGGFAAEKPPALRDEAWAKVRAGSVKLEKGFHTLQIRLKSGKLEWTTLDLRRIDAEPFRQEKLLEQSGADDVHGFWSRDGEDYVGSADADAKMYGGSPRWTDYRIETTVRVGDEPFGEAGVLLRATNESDFPDQVKDALTGYFVSVNGSKLMLYRLNYDSTLLQAVRLKLPRGEAVKLRIEAEGSEIRVYVGDGAKPELTYDDPDAFLQGRVGIRSVYADKLTLGDLSVASLQAE
ncbi:family 43 glycosylhydrolase [Cohnella cellulosilytica]|uniref:family 43 glycosylhydrolase n=1 Tax=Cohnella cellulosilytica TaxID=986710 RepID=UPI0035EF03F0